jgi:hypothetical protein
MKANEPADALIVIRALYYYFVRAFKHSIPQRRRAESDAVLGNSNAGATQHNLFGIVQRCRNFTKFSAGFSALR